MFLIALAGYLIALGGCSDNNTGDVQLALVGASQASVFAPAWTPSTSSTGEAHHDIVSAMVTVKAIDARVHDAWIPVVTKPQTLDLLALDDKTLNTLGFVSFPPGHIHALRLVLDEVGAYVLLKNGAKKPLEVPDNGIVKIVGELDVDSCAAGIVIVDFDPKIKVEGGDGDDREFELRCVAHIKTEELKNTCSADGGPGPSGADMGLCAGVVCPIGQVCQVQNGKPLCVADPCANVVCPQGQTCSNGVCH